MENFAQIYSVHMKELKIKFDLFHPGGTFEKIAQKLVAYMYYERARIKFDLLNEMFNKKIRLKNKYIFSTLNFIKWLFTSKTQKAIKITSVKKEVTDELEPFFDICDKSFTYKTSESEIFNSAIKDKEESICKSISKRWPCFVFTNIVYEDVLLYSRTRVPLWSGLPALSPSP